MSVEIITKEDLQAFKIELLADLRMIIREVPEKPKEWMKSAELKKLLKVSHGTLQNLRISGQLKFSKIGGTYYYRYHDLLKLLENGMPKFL
ncbi:helix-turn-helix domain-containing protein [Mucilaginibacter mali]|uniref:Helix-turn-helix domain-containing protein n=1 Tax=Mucilaginibacter mali TaxID=2740462 RepID=A0A7D4QD48_9SPHI|nr:helix-turn-helix domain-containing protein [Mucilaginibacter mali]QKJ32825.1 helix-turn-helix domain-containing protein [Mucilaginibacter mali]